MPRRGTAKAAGTPSLGRVLPGAGDEPARSGLLIARVGLLYFGHVWTGVDTHLTDFLSACNRAGRPKTLDGLTPFDYICQG